MKLHAHISHGSETLIRYSWFISYIVYYHLQAMHVLRFILSIMQFINKILQREMCEKSRDMKAT